MKKFSFIILGTIAIALIGLVVWQLMWMSDVVDNYNGATSKRLPDEKINSRVDEPYDKAAKALNSGQPAEQENDTQLYRPGNEVHAEVEQHGERESDQEDPAEQISVKSRHRWADVGERDKHRRKTDHRRAGEKLDEAGAKIIRLRHGETFCMR